MLLPPGEWNLVRQLGKCDGFDSTLRLVSHTLLNVHNFLIWYLDFVLNFCVDASVHLLGVGKATFTGRVHATCKVVAMKG